MKQYETQAAAAVVGLAAFELIKVWQDTAPSIAECRASTPDNVGNRQKLFDADVVVGTLALAVGTAFAVLAKDYAVLIILIVTYGILSLTHHMLFNSTPVDN